MSKAEKRYLEHFQDGRLRNCSSKEAFLLGYHQAEKDNALSWEDMKLMQEIQLNVCARKVKGEKMTEEEQFSEVLKLFLEQKGGKV